MVRMPNFAEDIERELGDLLHRRPGQSQAPAPSPVSIKAAPAARPTEEPIMSLVSDLKSATERLDKIGDDAVTKTEAIVGSPIGATALTLLHDVVGLNIDPKIIESALGGLQALLQAYAADTAPASPAADGTPAAPAAA